MNNKNKKINSRAQLQSSETIFVVFIIIIIIVISLIFYSRVESEKQKEKARMENSLRLVSFAHSITNWPELECSSLDAKDFDCIDLYKINLLSKFINDSKFTKSDSGYAFNYYSDALGRSTIVVNEIYSISTPRSWVVFNNSKEGLSRETIQIPVNIKDPIDQTITYAIMEISTYG